MNILCRTERWWAKKCKIYGCLGFKNVRKVKAKQVRWTMVIQVVVWMCNWTTQKISRMKILAHIWKVFFKKNSPTLMIPINATRGNRICAHNCVTKKMSQPQCNYKLGKIEGLKKLPIYQSQIRWVSLNQAMGRPRPAGQSVVHEKTMRGGLNYMRCCRI